MSRRHTAGVAILGFTVLSLVAPSAALAAGPAERSDFDGDGIADLVVGVPSEDFGDKADVGVVHVLYSTRNGPSASGDQLWSKGSPGIKGKHGRGHLFGDAIATGDFDRDGFADLAVGAPTDDLGGVHGPGSVHVLYGTRHGLEAHGERWSQANLPGDLEHGDAFGRTLAAADYDGDGYADLAIGAPWEDDGSHLQAGVVQVIFGGRDGLHASGARTLDWAMTGAPAADPILFGHGLAGGDLDGDGAAELVVSSSGVASSVGAVAVFPGSPNGPTAEGVQTWSQDSPGVLDDGESNDFFGDELSIGDFDGNGYGDLAATVGGEDAGGCPSGPTCPQGAIAVLYGSAAGLTADGNQLWHADLPGVPGAGTPKLKLPRLAAGDLDGDGADDLVATLPGVTVLYGGDGGLTTTGAQLWTENSPGVPGTDEPRDAFGNGLAIADYGRSSVADLAVGVVGERVGGHRDAGRLVLLFGTTSGVSSDHAQSWSQDTPGVQDHAEAYDRFGVPGN